MPNYNSVVAAFCHALAAGDPQVVDDKGNCQLVRRGHDCRSAAGSSGLPHAGSDPRFRARPTMVSEVTAADGHRRELPDGAAAGPVGPVHMNFSTPPVGDVPRALPGSGSSRQMIHVAGWLGAVKGARRACAGVLLDHQPRLHPRPAQVSAQGGAVPRPLRAGRDPAAETVHRRVVTFRVSGAEPAIVDMPTFWVHSITNTGTQPLVTLFFADELL